VRRFAEHAFTPVGGRDQVKSQVNLQQRGRHDYNLEGQRGVGEVSMHTGTLVGSTQYVSNGYDRDSVPQIRPR